MIPLVLTPSEVLAALADTLTEIRRPVTFADGPLSKIAPYPFARQCDDGGWCFADAPLDGSLWEALRGLPGKVCPLGAPGNLLFGQEVWGVGCRPDPFDGCRDGVEYQADEPLLDDGDDLPLNGVELPDGEDLCEWEGKGWQPAETMPEWASRIRLVNRGVRVERADVWMWCVAVEVSK